jgi:hypothetical protein
MDVRIAVHLARDLHTYRISVVASEDPRFYLPYVDRSSYWGITYLEYENTDLSQRVCMTRE